LISRKNLILMLFVIPPFQRNASARPPFFAACFRRDLKVEIKKQSRAWQTTRLKSKKIIAKDLVILIFSHGDWQIM
jgi:hypothetical protein